jgi:hypothetical protein
LRTSSGVHSNSPHLLHLTVTAPTVGPWWVSLVQ